VVSPINPVPSSPRDEAMPETPGWEVGRLTEAGRRRFAEACARGYLVTEQGDADGALGAVWSAWCRATRRASVTVFRYRGVNQPARSSVRWQFLALAGIELSLVPAGRRLTPAGIATVADAFAEAGIGSDQPWSMAPQRVSVGRVPVEDDERLARMLVRIGRCPSCAEPELPAG
jgi:hypothetical protein